MIRRERHDASIIMMSAYSVAEIEREVLHEGALAFMRKPVDVDRILELLRGDGVRA